MMVLAMIILLGEVTHLEAMPLALRMFLLLHRMRHLSPILQVHLMIVIILLEHPLLN